MPAMAMGRVAILGFDALDPRLCQRWMDEGALPNLKRLAETGGYRPLATTSPCQSPVAWRSFATGCNPGQHGVFDFLTRTPGSYLPEIGFVGRGSTGVLPADWQRWAVAAGTGAAGMTAVAAATRARWSRRALLGAALGLPLAGLAGRALSAWLPREVPIPVNRAGGTPFWADLGDHGLRTTALWVPAEFPAQSYPHARVLSGLGVPDARGTTGTFTVFTTADDDANTELGGQITHVVFVEDRAATALIGPPSPLQPRGQPMRAELGIERVGAGSVRLRCGDGSAEVAVGEWSPWLPVTFADGPLVRVHGRVRFHLGAAAPDLDLYATAVNFDPERLPATVALSAPRDYAAELVDRHGFAKTVGWPTETWALTEERIDDATYLDDFTETFATQRAIALAELERGGWDCFAAVFLPTDHIQHTFWRTLDPEHARHEPDAPARVRDAIRDAYVDCDRLVGEVVQRLGPDDTLIVLSDHGFHPWRTAVNLNRWLVEHGWMTLRAGAPQPAKTMQDLASGGLFFEHVDWFNTRAYSLGLGNIYLNLAGREPEGIVQPGGEAEALLARLRQDLLKLTDPQGEPVVRSAYLGSGLYHGPFAASGADLLVGFHPGYRVSWQTCLGGAPEGVFAANDRKWSGDHCSLDPAITPGVVFCNRPLPESPSILDVAPSVLRRLGVAPPPGMDGRAWW